MNPWVMTLVLVGLTGLFARSALRRWRLLRVGDSTHESRVDAPAERLGLVWTFAFFQKKMRYYFTAGLAHNLIFAGFLVLLLRTLVLWGRGFVPEFNLFVLGPDGFLGLPLGEVYSFLKDVFALLVMLGAAVFIYYRTVDKQKRMAQSMEGLVILGIIVVMMVSDIFYDGAAIVLNHRVQDICNAGSEWCGAAQTIVAPLAEPSAEVAWHAYPEPAGTFAATLLSGAGNGALVVVSHIGFWAHASLVLVFLNVLPHSKHFHIITAIPNVFLADVTPKGRLPLVAKSTEDIMDLVEKASEDEDMGAARVGYSRIEHFSWKDILDFYTCTECGRCSDNCPATLTGKKLSPKQLTLDLRDHLYQREDEFLALGDDLPRWQAKSGESEQGEGTSDADVSESAANGSSYEAKSLLPDVIDPDVAWACTTCRACEEQCPVMISYVDKIVQMRRQQVVIKGEFPAELNKPFEGMEVNGNPWNLSRMDRANWAEGLGIPMSSDKPDAEVLFWVGCAASYDDRAKRVARNTAELLKLAGVDFAILGQEESCTGDPARRAGNEYLFTMLAETNVETINSYKEQGGVKQILTTCPHCFNTLLNEYPDFGGKYEVVHHTDYLLGLLSRKMLSPKHAVNANVAYHDSCYLGRYNEVYEQPREILRRIPGVTLTEPTMNRNKGLCCGAGGAQMWMEEQNKNRVNIKRTKQLLETGANVISSACPFCMTMLTDGLKSEEKESEIRQLDVVELLAESCLDREQATATAS